MILSIHKKTTRHLYRIRKKSNFTGENMWQTTKKRPFTGRFPLILFSSRVFLFVVHGLDAGGDVFDDFHREGFAEVVQTLPLVIDADDGAFDGLVGVAELPEEFAVESPFEGEGVLALDAVGICLVVGNPLALDEHFRAGDCEHHALVVAFFELRHFARLDFLGKVFRQAILPEVAGGVDELQGLTFRLLDVGTVVSIEFYYIVCISISI